MLYSLLYSCKYNNGNYLPGFNIHTPQDKRMRLYYKSVAGDNTPAYTEKAVTKTKRAN